MTKRDGGQRTERAEFSAETSRYDELMAELESEGAAEWTDHEAASFQRDVEAAYLAGELTREQYSYLIRES